MDERGRPRAVGAHGNAINSLDALEQTISALPTPPAGHARVFRGQTADFPAMLPSGYRPHAPPIGRLWDIALMHVRQQTSPAGTAAPTDSTDASVALMMDLIVWHKVMAQHYGPGSPYLDVTTAPEVALWFALNANESAGKLDHFTVSQTGLGPLPLVCPTLRFGPHRGELAWFYVLDVPLADGTRMPQHGELLDLTAGPEFLSTCLRLVRQHGGLVFGEREVAGGDLSRYYACPPIAIARPFAGCPFIDRDARFLFPDPDEDEWYGRLLQAPIVPKPGTTHGCEYRQSLGVYLVMSPEDENAEALLDRQMARTPWLARGMLRALGDARRRLRAACGVDPEAATYVQVEIPLLIALAPPERWNQSVLATGLARRTQPLVEASRETLPAVSLENVLVQLSPLETALHELPTGATLVTAVWLVRHGERFQVTFMTAPQEAASGGSIVGPIDVEFSPADHGFTVLMDGARQPILGSGLPQSFVKTFFVVVDLLRGLSATVKPDAYPSISTGRGQGDGMRVLVPVRRVSTVLTRAKSDPLDLRLHFLRHAVSLQPFLGPGLELASVGVLTLEIPGSFATLPSVHDVYGSAAQVTLGGIEVDVPAREGMAPSASVAAFVEKLFNGDMARVETG